MRPIANTILTGALILLLGSALACALAIPQADNSPLVATRSGTSTEDTTYILPIWEGALASHDPAKDLAVLEDMKQLLGVGGSKTKLGWSFSSWALSRDIQDATQDYNFNPTNLKYMLDLAVKAGLPILVHMNNGRWADCCTPNSDGGWGDLLLDFIASKPDTTMLDSTGASQFGHNYGSNYFTLSRLNDAYRNYKKRNTEDSARVIAEWAKANPSLFAGVSLSSETIYPKQNVDHNPLATAEWKMWLRNTDIYGPGGEYFGAGRVPAFDDINEFNTATGQSFASWDSVIPPAQVVPGDVFAEEWERWRIQMIINHVSDETLWIASAGIDRNLIFGHATPRVDDYTYADSIETATAANGAGGVTYYGWNPADFGKVNNPLRGVGKNNWGVFELNPLTTNSAVSYNNLLNLYNDGVKIICPNSWEGDSVVKDQYAIFGSPQWGDTFGNNIKQFLLDHGNNPRDLQPTSWNPGNKVYDLYDHFDVATKSGIDNHLEPAGTVGNVVRKSILSHVEGVLTYSIKLPDVSSGERLNFWTSVGIKDGAGIGGEVQFQVTINGKGLFGPNFHLNPNYWLWKRWVPIMVDVTDWAGQTISLTLHTTGNTRYGWTIWGSPAIYLATGGTGTAVGASNNLALGASVSTSSEAGTAWRSPFVTDGSGSAWSSVSHPTAEATEWVVIDLGSSKNIGKVVAFPREDLSTSSGTGFPTAFEIQSSDSVEGPWNTLLSVNDYPHPRAGDGQVLTFPSTAARFVRIYATVLSGVGSEATYRFQLAEVEIYS
ncbi:hypothetical protein B0O99DRAFT_711793 [Bisporella sp. PMI_857]|nr:hypothetical protein B0O99DRAFT_711793 [Bisporella sp. PMI_857]